MKRFSELIAEAPKPRSQVLLFGRMNPPTRGHEENVMAAHSMAQKSGAGLSIVGSHSHDAKKNPLAPAQKLTHLNRAFGHLKNTTISTSNAEHPTILHQAALLHKQGIRHLSIVGGGDRAASHLKLLKQYNGVKGPHGYYKFEGITGANTGERKEGISGTDMRRHAQSGNYAAFKKNLPSRIAANEKHSQELYNHVRSGLAKNETIDRETYIQGALKLGELVEDSQTGFQGRIVYRGPTYVTIQITEELSLKRWINNVDVLYSESTKESTMDNFRHFMMQEAKEAPKEQASDLSDADLAAIEAQVEHMSEEQLINLSEEADQELDQPTPTLEQIAKKHNCTVEYLTKQLEAGIKVEHEHTKEASVAREIALDHLNEKPDYYVKLKKVESVDLEERDLTAAQRMKMKMQFMKSKAKRQIARQISMKKMATQGRLKQRAIKGARNLIMSRLLRGRTKAQLSAAEKTRIENIVSKAKQAVARISNKLLPKLRQLELKRLKHMHEQLGSERINKVNLDVPGPDTESTASTGHVEADRIKRHLAGVRNPDAPVPGHDIDPANTMRRLKHFRKLEV